MPIAELLNNLIALQAVDKDIYDYKRQLAEIPTTLKRLDLEAETSSSIIKKKDDELKIVQLKRKEKEIDLEAKENSIKKFQSQLYQVKTNNEYNALDKEIGGLKADKSLLEEEILGIFDKIELLEKELAAAKKTFTEEKNRIDSEKAMLESVRKDIETNTAGLEEKRRVILPLIDKETLGRYERILRGKDGAAFVAVKGENCGGCFVHLPPQVINEIKLKEKIVYCERCARMLYTED